MAIMETRERIFTDEIKKLTPILGAETVSNLAKSYLLADEDTRKRIVEVVDAMRAAVATDKELKNSILIEPPERGLISGDIELGNILFGKKKLYPFSVKSSDLLSHMGIFGSSGYGKTNIAYCLTEKLSEKGIPVIIFDFSKRNYKEKYSHEHHNRSNGHRPQVHAELAEEHEKDKCYGC